MNDASFCLIFDGAGVENGEIDVKDLAPSLMALGELIQAANTELNGDRAKIAVKLTATRKGSFEVSMTLVQEFGAQALALLDSLAGHKDGIAAANELADIIFKVGGGVSVIGGGFFALIKWLRNRKPDKIETKGGETQIHIGDNIFITNPQVVKLAENLEVREQARNLVAVLSNDGIDEISTRRGTDEKLTIKKNEAQFFDVPDVEEETLEDSEREMFLQIDSLSFKEGNKWRVTDGGEPFYAVIEDVDFLNQIAKGDVSFSKNDNLHCRVREHQIRTSKGQLRKERSIIRVIEHKPGSRQLKLL
jgi:hypothetical protein